MILEAFQAAIVRHADSIVLMLIGGFGFMALVAFAAAGEIIRKRRPGYHPSSAGDRPEPPRSGSGVQHPLDRSFCHTARVARLRAELAHLVEHASRRPILEDRLQEALASARDTLEATKS